MKKIKRTKTIFLFAITFAMGIYLVKLIMPDGTMKLGKIINDKLGGIKLTQLYFYTLNIEL